MALLSKVAQGGTFRLRDDVTGEWLGRINVTTHADRLIRDANLAEALWTNRALTGATRRTAFQNAFNAWVTAGGRAVDMSGLTLSLLNDGGIEDGNLHLYISGGWAGYLHSTTYNGNRLLRFIRLAEEVFAGSSQGSAALRQTAYDAAMSRFTTDGGIAG